MYREMNDRRCFVGPKSILATALPKDLSSVYTLHTP